ncbi:MAG: PAS domain-containing protein [Rhodomicrobium sp.]
MLHSAPILFHLDLYRYWLGKCRGRLMPARSDINAPEIPALLPYLSIVDRVDGRLRYRLAGTAIAQQVGYDPTGTFVGYYIAYDPKSSEALEAVGERVFATRRPTFLAGQYQLKQRATHSFSALVLPLSEDGANVNMLLFIRIARFNLDAKASKGWLDGTPLQLTYVGDVHDAADLEKQCLNWERGSLIDAAV